MSVTRPAPAAPSAAGPAVFLIRARSRPEVPIPRFPARLRWWLPVLVSAALCFGHLPRWSLWQDEAFTWMLMTKDVPQMITMAGQDRHPPLYYLIVAAFRWLGDRDVALRLPSALAVVAAVGVVRRAAARHVGEGAAEVAAWMLALSPYALLYANTARMYGLLVFWGASLFAASLGVARGERPLRSGLALMFATAGTIWTHYAGAAAIAAAGLGAGLDLVIARRADWKLRLGVLVVAMALAGASFTPWALGPLQFQLANKDVATDRTLTVMAYAWWNVDSRVPALSWLYAAAQVAGVAVALKRRDALLLGWVVAAFVFPYLASRSGPAQNPRNYSDLLPVACVLVGVAAHGLARRALAMLRRGPDAASAVAVGVILAFAVEPLHDLWARPVSPQEPGTGFDYRTEAAVFDRAVPANGGLYFRPTFLLTQYRRYAPALEARGKRPVDRYAWLASARSEWVDGAVSSRYTPQCTFDTAFRQMVYAPSGPGCDALNAWVAHLADVGGADGRGYVPFQLELAKRALAANDLPTARRWAERADGILVAHPAAALTLAEVAMRQEDWEAARVAATHAVDITRSWRWAGPTIAQAYTALAKALEKLDRADDRARALAAANCARTVQWPFLCGTGPGSGHLMGWLPLAPSGGPPPAVAPLPALRESQTPAPPAAAPAGTTRLLDGAALWALDGEVLPSDWTDAGGTATEPSAVMAPVDGFQSLVLASTPERSTALACVPRVPASPHMAIRARWRADYQPGEGRTWMFFEARMADADGKVLQLGGAPVMERPLTTASGTSWRVDRFDFHTPPDAKQVRICLKVDGKVPARMAVDWFEVLSVDDAAGSGQ